MYYYDRFTTDTFTNPLCRRPTSHEVVQFMSNSVSRGNKKVKIIKRTYIKYKLYYTSNNFIHDDCNKTRTSIIALTLTPNMQQTDNNDVQTGVFFACPPSLAIYSYSTLTQHI